VASVAAAKIDANEEAASGAEKSARVQTSVPGLCLMATLKHNKSDALNHKTHGEWIHIPAKDFVQRVRHVALGLSSLGIRAGDRVALISENRPEWSITDLAILSLGAVNVPIYTTQAVDQIEYILKDSGARALFVSGKKVFKHAAKALADLSMPLKLIFFDDEAAVGIDHSTTLNALEENGKKREGDQPRAYDEILKTVSADDLATIIYTSGTTGEPKGVMLSHGNFISNVLSITDGLPIAPTDIALSVLPLSHIFERAGFYIFCYNGVSVYYCASFEQVAEHLREVRPTLMTAVPRLFEKVYHRIIKKGMSAKGWRRRIFERALKTGHRYAELQDKRKPIPVMLALEQKIADRLVFSKWRAGIGGRLRYFVSGGAPLAPTLSYAFFAAGIPILQGYGATETCVVTANRPDNNLVGSVGPPFAGIEVAIAEDGEIIIRGPNVMLGYYGQPEATARVLKDGWFATGDVGHMDNEGRLYITDRKKEMFKLSNGKYIAPQLLESLIKESEFVSQVVVVGAGRKQPAALIVPEWEALKHELKERGESVPSSHDELSENAAAIKLIQKDAARLTAELADHERIHRVALLPHELTIDNGELTPTLKVKRRVIDEKFGDAIEKLYS
jgi:long-chain acyl-CoA synthetase